MSCKKCAEGGMEKATKEGLKLWRKNFAKKQQKAIENDWGYGSSDEWECGVCMKFFGEGAKAKTEAEAHAKNCEPNPEIDWLCQKCGTNEDHCASCLEYFGRQNCYECCHKDDLSHQCEHGFGELWYRCSKCNPRNPSDRVGHLGAEGICGCGTKKAESLHRMHSHCADCQCELNSKTHKMDTSASEGGAGGGHGALCDSCFVGGSKMRLDKKAEEPTVEEPDWIPDGDGRAIGQQNYGINLSPLHADTVGTPSPTFNEDITGQDGPSAEPTNAVFEGTKGVSYAGRYGPQAADMTRAREQLKRYGYIKDDGDIVQDIFLYNDTPSKKTGRKADKYHYFALIEKDDRYYAINIYGPSKSLRDIVNILGPTGDKSYNMTSTGDARHARSVWLKKQNAKIKKGYRPVLFGKKGNIMEWTGSGFSAETLAEIEGPTAEATSGGLHAPSSFAMTWEDGAGYSSASIPPNEIAWAEGKSTSWMTWACGIALVLAGGALLKAKSGEQKAADNLVNAINKRKGCCGGKRADTAHNEAKQQCESNGCRWFSSKGRGGGFCNCDPLSAAHGGGVQNQQDGGVTFQSEFSVGQINPVEVEGQNDVYGAEEFSSPKVSQPNWGPQKTYRQNARRNLKMW